MTVLINFKICDNSSECSGISVCKTGALSWDNKEKTIKIDNSKCISCGECERACMVDAIKVAKNPKEYQKLKEEIESDYRKISDLFVDRYGAQPIHPGFLIDENTFEKEIIKNKRLMAVEFFKNESLMCLLRSITLKELIGNYNILYKKVELKNDIITKKYNLNKIPSLVFFKNGKAIGKIEGYFSNEELREIKEKIDKIIKNEKTLPK
jgi:Fe-S-cluster-containing dehydrogenase component